MGDWRKSTWSKNYGDCVEAATWRKSSASMHNGQCVEAGQGTAGIAVRDSKDPGAVLVIPAAAWRTFTRRVSQP